MKITIEENDFIDKNIKNHELYQSFQKTIFDILEKFTMQKDQGYIDMGIINLIEFFNYTIILVA